TTGPLDADRVLLGLGALGQRQRRQDLLRQVAAHAVAEDREPGTEVDAWLERCLPLSFAIDPAVAGAHADDAVTLEEHFRSREPCEDVNAFRLDERRQPLAEAAQRDGG